MSGKTKLNFKGQRDGKKTTTQSDEIDFMYYPDIENDNFYDHLWRKKEFYENRSEAREYHEDPVKKKTLLKKSCAPDVLKLKNHQIFLRNFLSPETPYNSVLVYHGVGTGKCLHPDSLVYLDGKLIRIEDIWDKYHSKSIISDLEGEWSKPSEIIMVNSYDESNKKIIEWPIHNLYRQQIKEKIVVLTLIDGEIIKITKAHHLLTENGWSNDFKNNKFISIPTNLKHKNKIIQLNQSDKDEVILTRIIDYQEEDYQGYVFDLEIQEHHNYVANGIICHNTCAAVTMAEGLKDMVEKYNKKIFVIAGKLLQGNFRSTLYNLEREKNSKYPGSLQCTKTTYYIPAKKKENVKEKAHREKAIHEMQKKYYEYMGYIAFVHYVNKEVIGKGYDLGEFFDNTVFIIDEAHNLIAKSGKSRSDEDSRKTRQKLHDIFKVAKNTKLILLTATPITNEIDDILVLVNLLRANDHRKTYRSTELSTDAGNKLTKDNLNIAKFTDYVKGYISYFRGAHPSTFPIELPQTNYNRDLQFDMFGDELSTRLPNFMELNLMTCEMSPFHFYNYFSFIMELERNKKARSTDKHGDILKLQSATATYPYPDPNYPKIGSFDITTVFLKEKKDRIEKYKYRTNEKFLDIHEENEEYLHSQDLNHQASSQTTIGYPLAKYSSKFYRLFYDIINTFGINFVFTRYKTNVGTVAISLLLEQNGYVRYHSNLGKVNEFTGKYREGVNNQLDIRDVKFRCICGYLVGDHIPKYQGKNDYSDPQKHRFLQGTYLRVDGDTSDNFETHRKKLNSIDNKYGQIIKVIVGGQNLREGIDLSHVRSVHIMNPWHNLISLEQTIGRAIRMCSHANLDDPNEMNVKVFKYVSIPPQQKLSKEWSLSNLIEKMQNEDLLRLEGVNFQDQYTWEQNIINNDPTHWMTIDEYIYARALNKDYNIKFAERLMKKASIDCFLNLEANLAFPNDIDGSRACDYTDCKYQCTYTPNGPSISKPKINLDTYDMYFMEPKVQEAMEVIGDLFTRNWALTLKSVVKLANNVEKSLNRDIIYLALDRMLGDPPRTKASPVIDRFGRYGYLIYRHPFYVYQPQEIMDESLPIYNRQIPSRPSKREIDIKDLIKPPKKIIIMKKPLKKKSPSDKLSNQPPPSGLGMTPTRFASQIENLLAPIQNEDQATLASVLDFLNQKQHTYLIRTRIEEKCEKGSLNALNRRLMYYYLENFIVGHTKMLYDDDDRIDGVPIDGHWVYNLGGRFWNYNCEREIWLEIHEDHPIMKELKIRQLSGAGPFLSKNKRKLSGKIYGFLSDDNLKREIKFKITDVAGQQVKTKRNSTEINSKTQTRGQVCGNYSNDELKDICDKLQIRYSRNLQRNNLCSLIERKLRLSDQSDKKTIWFLNYINYKRKFNKLEDNDIRSLYNFYNDGDI